MLGHETRVPWREFARSDKNPVRSLKQSSLPLPEYGEGIDMKEKAYRTTNAKKGRRICLLGVTNT